MVFPWFFHGFTHLAFPQDFADRIATLPAASAKHKVIKDAQHENAVDCARAMRNGNGRSVAMVENPMVDLDGSWGFWVMTESIFVPESVWS